MYQDINPIRCGALLYRMRLESALVRLSRGVLEELDMISGRI